MAFRQKKRFFVDALIAIVAASLWPGARASGELDHRVKWSEIFSASAGESSRKLQSTCSSFSITSTALPAAEGCYSEVGFEVSGKPVYSDGTTTNVRDLVVFAISLSSNSSSDADEHWAVGYVSELTAASSGGGGTYIWCLSVETVTAADHPVDATYVCDVDSDYDLDSLTSGEFILECDCDGTSSATTSSEEESSATSTTTGSDDSPTPAASTCSSGGSFTITSSEFPDTEGCYVDSGEEHSGTVVYATSVLEISDLVLGDYVVHENDVEYTSGTEIVWQLGIVDDVTETSLNVVVSTESVCISQESSEDVHPADATWTCEIDGGVDSAVATSQFSVTCGCTEDEEAAAMGGAAGLAKASWIVTVFATVTTCVALAMF